MFDSYSVGSGEPGVTIQHSDSGVGKKARHPIGQVVDHSLQVVPDAGHVDACCDVDPPGSDPISESVGLGHFDEGLGRDAPHVQAGSTHCMTFHQGYRTA